MKDKYFYFNESSFLVTGKKKAAVYDLLNGDIFSLTENASKILEAPYASIGERLKTAKSVGVSIEDANKLFEDLVAAGLGRITDERIFCDKINFDFPAKTSVVGSIQLKEVVVRLNETCNLNCSFCEKNSNRGELCFPCNRNTNTNGSDLKLLKKIPTIIKDASLFHCEMFRFTGGDPFLLGDEFLKILIHASEKIKYVEVFSNLTSIDEHQKDFIARHNNIHLNVPIFGSNRKSYEDVTGVSGSFEVVLKNIRELKKKGVKLSVVIVKRRGDSVESLVEFLRQNKLDYRFYVPTPLTNENEKLFELFDGFSVNNAFPQVEFIDFFWNRQYNNCVGQRIVIDADGSIMPCLYAKEVAYGSIFKENIKNVLREGRQDKHWDLIKDNTTECNGCEYRYGCSADCMVASKNIKGDLNEKYPFCNYDPVNGAWKKNEV